VKLDTRRITDWATSHAVFAEVFGFPDFNGLNLDAWIDCISWLDDSAAGMASVSAPPGGVVVLQLEHFDDFARRCPELLAAIVDCAAFVNWRRVAAGKPAVLALSYSRID
jgi:hypothetical protein